jgi:hypothetical protein
MTDRAIVTVVDPEENVGHHAERLATHGALLGSWLSQRSWVPPRWRSPVFGRVVDRVRSHLAPITSRDLLALSYGREQFHIIAIGRPPDPLVLLSRDATEVAYALRWLELGSSKRSADWADLLEADS